MRSALRDVEGAVPYSKLQSLNVGTDAYCAVSLCHFVTSPSHREEVFPGGPPQDSFREGTEALPSTADRIHRRGAPMCAPTVIQP